MLDSLRNRQHQPELLDAPDADPHGISSSLRCMRIFNRVLGYDRLIVRHLEIFSASWDKARPIRVLDVGTGSADIPLVILRWAAKKGFDVKVVAIDLHPLIVQKAAAVAQGNPRLQVVRADAMRLPFENDAFDYATTSMFLHHLDEPAVEKVLQEMARVSRRGIIASDLLRLRRSYVFVTLTTLFANWMVRHDAKVSVLQAFNEAEILAIRDRSGVTFAQYFNYMTHRFVLAGEKSA